VGDGGPANLAILLQAEGVATDARGNIYISDAAGHRVRQVSPDGTIRTIAGTGVKGYSGDGGPATAARLNSPYGVTVDAVGNVYVADLGNSRVRRISANGTITTLAAAPLISPRNLALDRGGVLYVSDFDGHRVYRLFAGGSLEAVAGTGTAGFAGEGGAAAGAQLGFPAALAVDSRDNTLYIGDTQNHAVRRVAQGLIASVARVATPTGLALDGLGTLYVADQFGGVIYRIARGGQSFAMPVAARDLAMAADGSLYAADGRVVRRILASGIVSVAAGGGNLAFGDGSDAIAARLNRPSGVAVDAAGNIYIADRENHRIRKVGADGKIATVAGIGSPGDSGDGGPATQAQLNRPSSVSVDATGNLWIADTGNGRVRRVSPLGQIVGVAAAGAPVYAIADASGAAYIADEGAGKILRAAGGSLTAIAEGLKSPRGLALDRIGNLYFTEAGAARVRKLTPGLSLSDIAEGAWSIPRGVAVDDAGNVYVADTGRQQIVRVDSAGRAVAIAGTGEAGFSGDGDAALAARLGFPWDVARAEGGKLYVADLDNNRIRVLTPAQFAPPSPIVLADAVNAASLAAGAIAPGMLVAIRGSGVTPGEIPETQFLFGGLAARFVSIDRERVLVEAPLAMAASGSVTIDVRYRGFTRVAIPAVAAPAAPGLFVAAPGEAAASNEDGSPNSPANPAGRGSVLALYGTGLGVAPAPVAVQVSGLPSEVLYAGPTGAFPGVFQINVRLPAELSSGTHVVVVSVGEASSQPGVTVSLR
jgi:uncharacterized protein (TIGR03437 family)